ncbi:ribose 5-phosphate isomerase B [Niastella populi]|uniref:Ribose 5-phosphate isomerase B n=1 Tax=Niastella populi TaxID=550983 RepID=A0A1V9GBY8_9BACT|nr:ribose 5-phosphate isomerase B [Niastella populi]OQP67988.1 ribose 5-phosphate isomerase B [Niastella populi]
MFDLSKPIAIGSDHAGFDYKVAIVKWLTEKGYQVSDKGVDENKSVDYPDYAHPVADAVEKGESAFGILLCGSANGVCITANKHQGIRAGLAFEPEVARLIRQHNDANIIGIPARFVSLDVAKEMITLFIETPFEGGRHQTRVNKIACA